MSEVPGGSWDSPYLENFAHYVDQDPPIPDGTPDDGTGSADNGSTGNSAASNGSTGNSSASSDGPGEPVDVHAWYTKGTELLGRGSPAAAAQLLQRAANAEPASRSVREALARAQFDTGQYEAAAANFRTIVEASPTDDYAHFGLGLALARCGEHEAAAEHLALAAAMHPDRKHYTDALSQVRATLKSRKAPPRP